MKNYLIAVSLFALAGTTQAVDFNIADQPAQAGVRLQLWAQQIQRGASNGADMADFSMRRAYFYAGGAVNKYFSGFLQVAGDRIGQANITENTGNGIGSGFAVRDAWIVAKPADAFQVQMGRMFVPFMRVTGTESPFGQMTSDVPSFQQGNMIPGRRVMRDDGLALWGNVAGGFFQYRAAVMDGANTSGNDGSLRLAGRVSLSFLEPETGWLASQTYLEKKKVIAVGAGFDALNRIATAVNHRAWTVDLFANMPCGCGGAWTLDSAFGRFDQDATRYTGNYYMAVGGYLLPFQPNGHQIQPFVRYESFDTNDGVTAAASDEREIAGGVNWYLPGLGHKAKITLDAAAVRARGQRTQHKVTTQLQLTI